MNTNFTIADLEAQRRAIDEAIAAAKEVTKAEKEADIATIKGLIAKHGLGGKDIFERKVRIMPIKFRDSAGNTWTGQGKQPKWLSDAIAAGYAKELYAVTE